ncbi:MAG: hypothetical protein LBG71_01435 [Clostridiales Family XIII bacterium]|nr:hypothetical protein [Clostridiales Family XIII bacterium]
MARTDYFMDSFEEEGYPLLKRDMADGEAAARAFGTTALTEGMPEAEALESEAGKEQAASASVFSEAEKRQAMRRLIVFCLLIASGLLGLYYVSVYDGTRYDSHGNALPPAEVSDAAATAVSYAANSATNFNGKWGEWHKEMIASGMGEGFQDYAKNISFLRELIRQSRALNVFVIYRDGNGSSDVSVCIDEARAAPDIAGVAAVEAAWGGKAAAEPNPWDYSHDKPVWTAYAPIYDKEGAVVAVLGVDYPVPIIRSYPEWNKSSRRWNGFRAIME